MADKGRPRLTYFAGRGLAEVIRLALNAAQIEYEDIYMRTREEFLQLIKDGKLMFKQVPLLEMDGKNLIGSESTFRYVCKKGGFMGKTDDDQAMVEMLCLGARDMLRSGFSNFQFVAADKQEETLQKALKLSRERYLPVFEKTLEESKSGFLVGDSLTMADFMFYDPLSYINEIPRVKHELDAFPKCKAYIQHFSSQPGLKEYLASPQRHPPPDAAYVKEVNLVLNW
ncbi:glutathione S-transferase alpha-4-like [Diadema setosum]|uniref:glutathione S-transferase alpha-4-like n=1 Tax=Diadema setosum TaxID=31175 RepID=UPI003B3BCED0